MAELLASVNCHVVAIPYPGRGHINPMMNLCKLITLHRPSEFLITFVVTEEWLGFIGSEPKPTNVRFATIPNVIPSEVNRAADFPGFLNATHANGNGGTGRAITPTNGGSGKCANIRYVPYLGI
ncbi:hypothetical protein L1887_05565 [Cichorium endivia]|nr:hypothetical protein L1887_05565 [Cichorium endivia]